MQRQHTIYDDIVLHQLKDELKQAQKQVQEATNEQKKAEKLATEATKKHQTLEKEHKEARKELHKFKMQFDPNYAFEKKQVQKETMARVRDAKTKKTKGVRELGKQQRTKKSGSSK